MIQNIDPKLVSVSDPYHHGEMGLLLYELLLFGLKADTWMLLHYNLGKL